MTIALAIAYFLAARLSLILLTEPDGVAVFWPAAGVSTGALIGLGSRARFPVITGTMAATDASTLWAIATSGMPLFSPYVTLAKPRSWPLSSDATLARRSIWTSRATFSDCSRRRLSELPFFGIGGTVGFELFHNSPVPTLTIWQHWFASDALELSPLRRS